MKPEQEFHCSTCEHREDTKAIPYDPLGFPVCPACGEVQGPMKHTQGVPTDAERALK